MDEEVIPNLLVGDVTAAVGGCERPGFTQEWEHRFEPGFPAFAEVARGRVRLFLSEHTGDARPDTPVCLHANDVDTGTAEFGAQMNRAPWAREVELRDPGGSRPRAGTPTE
jgi:hypothetical protein